MKKEKLEKIRLLWQDEADEWLIKALCQDVNEYPKEAAARELKEECWNLKADFYLDAPAFLSVSKTINEPFSHTDVSFCYLLSEKEKKIEYDKNADALYIRLQEKYVARTQELEEGLNLDFDETDHLIGVEVLDAVDRYSLSDIFNISTENLILEDGILQKVG